MPASPLSRLFDPRSIAVVGASASEEKPGFQILKALEPFRGAVHAVNPRGGDILGRPVHRSLGEVPEPVDLVALVLPARHSLAVLEDAAEAGAGAAFMVSGGFGETGDAGAALESEIASACRAGGIRLLGPNTSGFLRPSRGLACTFLPAATEIRPGAIGIVAQSGGINLTLAMMANAAGLGVSLAVGLGNAADLGPAETLTYLAADPETRAIVLHVEGVEDGRGLFDAVRAAAPVKPVIAIPVGEADLGGFAESHTGALMGSHRLTRSALRQAGAVVVSTLDDALDAAYALSVARLLPARNPGIGVLTGQAGPGLLIADILRLAGVSVPELAPATVERIANLLPPLTYMKNPVDTGRPGESFGAVLDAIAADDAVDAVLANALIEGGSLDLGGAAVDADREDGKAGPVRHRGRAPGDLGAGRPAPRDRHSGLSRARPGGPRHGGDGRGRAPPARTPTPAARTPLPAPRRRSPARSTRTRRRRWSRPTASRRRNGRCAEAARRRRRRSRPCKVRRSPRRSTPRSPTNRMSEASISGSRPPRRWTRRSSPSIGFRARATSSRRWRPTVST